MTHFIKKKQLWFIVGTTLALLIAIELTGQLWYFFRAPELEILDPSTNPVSESKALEKSDALMRWQPYVYFRQRPYEGHFIHVDKKGIRRTINSTSIEKTNTKIFMYGGSGMWGWGVSDENTIPSSVSRILVTKGYEGVHVSNLAELGYVSTQNILSFLLNLRNKNIPDVAIFFNGLADVNSTYWNEEAGLTAVEKNRIKKYESSCTIKHAFSELNLSSLLMRRFANLATFKVMRGIRRRLIGQSPKPPKNTVIPNQRNMSYTKLPKAIVDTYFSNVKLATALSKEYGVKSYFFWYPVIVYKNHIAPEEETIYKYYSGKFEDSSHGIKLAYDHFSSRKDKPDNVYNLKDIFSETKEAIFLDVSHINPRGSEIIATEMINILEKNGNVLRKKPGRNITKNKQ